MFVVPPRAVDAEFLATLGTPAPCEPFRPSTMKPNGPYACADAVLSWPIANCLAVLRDSDLKVFPA